MGKEIDLLIKYQKVKRDLTKRLESKTEEVRLVARKFDKEFFDGERKFGYGGFSYNPKFWQPVIPTIVENYKIGNSSTVLDIGCAKGFFLYDLKLAFPGINVTGVDISEYAIANSIPEIKPYLQVGNATKLPFGDNYFDFVI